MAYLTTSELNDSSKAIALKPVNREQLESWLESAPAEQARWVQQNGFEGKRNTFCLMPGEDGDIAAVLVGMGGKGSLYSLAALPGKLPAGVYRLRGDWSRDRRLQACLGWGLACYRFERYREEPKEWPALLLEDDIADEVRSLHRAQVLVRDLVNTPTEHLGPQQLSDVMQAMADEFDAEFRSTVGEDLLSRKFPAVHAVGRASTRPPRLLELTWGQENHPVLALVGKGVCFDTGGLDLKSSAGMALMKKDMGGAAHVMALARLVMEHRVPVRLRLLVPAVENSVAGDAYRPGDVIFTRKGLSVEIGNTDAEGRVILSDALTYACEEAPDLVIDYATLTGAARIALGADLPPLFSNRGEVAAGIEAAGRKEEDPLWTMPLWKPYNELIKSPIADINNSGKSSFGGCITAALFLEHFVEEEIPWVHIDTFAWNQGNRPGRPQGGEALGLRAVFRYLQERYA